MSGASEQANPAVGRSRLQTLALDCYTFSPLVGLEESSPPESIWLDVSGSERLFGGERGMCLAVRAEMIRQGFRVRVAIADSWGAAWAVSHFGKSDIALVPSGQQAAWLAPLPIAALRIPHPVERPLLALGVATIGQLVRLPRTSLPSRFGKDLVRRMDQAMGLALELLTTERPAESLFVEWLFEEPVTDRQTTDHVCEVLLERLLATLDERRTGLRELACYWLGTTTEPTLLRLLRPSTDRSHLRRLLRLQCERRTFASSIHGIRMEVIEMGLSTTRQATLFDDDSHDKHPQALAELVDRLSIRLGRQAVVRPRVVPDHQPEFACEFSPWLDGQVPAHAESFATSSHLRCRPLRLLSSPQPLSVQEMPTTGFPRRVNQTIVVRTSGPERIETGWWRGPDVKRDYYRIDLATGATLWVFVECDTRAWFLHGVFV